MKKSRILLFILTLMAFTLQSCVESKNVAYLKDIEKINDNQDALSVFEPKIQQDDLLLITVSAQDPEAAIPFNLESTITTTPGSQTQVGAKQQQLYLVDNKGNIQFPILGEIPLAGLTKVEVLQLLKTKLKKYLNNPIVNIRITNFKISVQGEVTKPGTFTINSERVTLLEGLSMAGDLTIYGKRDNIIVIRELNGKKTVARIDISNSNFMQSPFYYLHQNDLIYVEPNKAKANTASVFNQNIPIMISIASLVSSAIFSILLIKK